MICSNTNYNLKKLKDDQVLLKQLAIARGSFINTPDIVTCHAVLIDRSMRHCPCKTIL